jgi:DNA repair exonuclease SbcCD ATPase subunit
MNGSLRDDRGNWTGGQVLLAVVLTYLLGGCAVISNLSPTPSVPVALAPDEVNAKIRELESKLGKDKKADPEGALAHELALLYVHPANRAPDYGKSLAMMRTYLSLVPQGEEDLETGRLAVLLEAIERLLRESKTQEKALSDLVAALLDAIERLGRLFRDSKAQEKALSDHVQALQQVERDAKKREQELLAEINTLQERIEKIQALDMEMEQRRRSVR